MTQSLIDLNRPYTVTAPGGEVHLLVVDAQADVPSAFALLGTQAEHKVAVRIGGGCKGMNTGDKLDMLNYFAEAFTGYAGVIWSGGTRAVTSDGQIDPMVTEVPGVIAANPGAIALGTAPRTDLFRIRGESQFVLDEYGTLINPAMRGVLVVQRGADGELDWDGDVGHAFKLTKQWITYGGFGAAGWVTWNGGLVTATEIRESATAVYPTFLVEGSGRETDLHVDAFRRGELGWLPKRHQLAIVPRSDPSELRDRMIDASLIRAA